MRDMIFVKAFMIVILTSDFQLFGNVLFDCFDDIRLNNYSFHPNDNNNYCLISVISILRIPTCNV